MAATTHPPAHLAGLLDAWRTEKAPQRVIEQVGRAQLVDVSGSDGSRPFLVAALAEASTGPLVVVTATTREADDLAAALEAFLPRERVAVFPSWETLPHERLSPRPRHPTPSRWSRSGRTSSCA